MRLFQWLVLFASSSLASSAALAVARSAQAAEACPSSVAGALPGMRLDAALDLAACYEQAGQLASAYAAVVHAIADAKATGHGEREQAARARAEALEPRLSKLSIFVLPSQLDRVQVERDGELVDQSELGLLVPVDAGAHHIQVFGAGLVPWSMEINVPTTPGEHTVMVPVLMEKALRRVLHSGLVSTPSQDGPTDRSFLAPTHRKVAVAAGSIGALGVSIGTIFGLRAISKSDESERRGCVGSLCPTVEGVEARRQAQLSSNVATVSMIAGLTGLATAAALFLLVNDDDADDDDQMSSSVAPRIVAEGGELIWLGRF
jgi:serine/threonine-protein kinase